jgi:hypothetical protein
VCMCMYVCEYVVMLIAFMQLTHFDTRTLAHSLSYTPLSSVHTHTHTYTYAHIHICTHTHMHTHIHIYTHTLSPSPHTLGPIKRTEYQELFPKRSSHHPRTQAHIRQRLTGACVCVCVCVYECVCVYMSVYECVCMSVSVCRYVSPLAHSSPHTSKTHRCVCVCICVDDLFIIVCLCMFAHEARVQAFTCINTHHTHTHTCITM